MIWMRAITTIYLMTSIPFRFAFLPDFILSFIQYPGFIILDLLSTIFFSYEAIRLAKHTHSLISPYSVLPSTFDDELAKEDFVGGHSLRSHDGSVVVDDDLPPRKTIWSYWRVLFYFISTIPFEYISIFFEGGGINTNYFLLNRLLRLYYLPMYLSNLSTMLVRKGYIVNIGVRRTWMLFFTMALAGHLCGCGFFYVAWNQALNGSVFTWGEVAGLYTVSGMQKVTMTSTAAVAYINSLYWAYITMITTGFGDIVPLHIAETTWCIFSMFIGVLITALTIANLQRTIGQFDSARLYFQRKIELIKKFMNYRELPKDIQDRVTSFYEYQWNTLKGADEEQCKF